MGALCFATICACGLRFIFTIRRWLRWTAIHEPNSVILDSFLSPIHSARLVGFQQKPDSLWCSRRQISPYFLSLGCQTLRVILTGSWCNQVRRDRRWCGDRNRASEKKAARKEPPFPKGG